MAKQDRGFASMDPEKQRRIASKGGKAAHAKGKAHEWNSEEARKAGKKGGSAIHNSRPGNFRSQEAYTKEKTTIQKGE